jgi:hypothetical protein
MRDPSLRFIARDDFVDRRKLILLVDFRRGADQMVILVPNSGERTAEFAARAGKIAVKLLTAWGAPPPFLCKCSFYVSCA